MWRFSGLLLSLLLIVSIPFAALGANHEVEMEQRALLERAKTPEDSIRILYQLFDVIERDQTREVADMLYDVAARQGNHAVQLDMMRQLANVYLSNDSILNAITARVEAMSKSEDQKQTLMFIEIVKSRNRSRYGTKEERRRAISSLMNEMETENANPNVDVDIQDRIVKLSKICDYIIEDSRGQILSNSLNELENLIENMPNKMYYLTNTFYVQAAGLYTEMGMSEQALHADSTMLSIIDAMEEDYHKQGRFNRSYDTSRYVIYRRMIFNMRDKKGSRDDIEDLYGKIQKLVQKDAAVARDYNKNRRADIFYYLATEDYAQLMPLLKEHINEKQNQPYKKTLLKAMMVAADSLGMHDEYRRAAHEYVNYLENYNEERADERSADLAITYHMSELQRENMDLLLAQKELEVEKLQKKQIFFAIVVPVFIILIIALGALLWRSDRMRKELEDSNRRIKEEHQKLMESDRRLIAARDSADKALRVRTEFVNNMTHEIQAPLQVISEFSALIAGFVDTEKHPALAKYIRLIEFNNDLVQRMVSDVLNLGAIDNKSLPIHNKHVLVQSLCERAVTTAKLYLAQGVEMRLIAPKTPIYIETDPYLAEPIIENLLSNAAKFTREGSVTLEFEIKGSEIEFIVTDSGPGIKKGTEELIFERFVKLNAMNQGVGLGLPVARGFARLLGGDVVLDTSYTKGARFIFTLPIEPENK